MTEIIKVDKLPMFTDREVDALRGYAREYLKGGKTPEKSIEAAELDLLAARTKKFKAEREQADLENLLIAKGYGEGKQVYNKWPPVQPDINPEGGE